MVKCDYRRANALMCALLVLSCQIGGFADKHKSLLAGTTHRAQQTPANPANALAEAVARNDVKAAAEAIRLGADVNYSDVNNYVYASILRVCTYIGDVPSCDVPMARFLIKQSANVNATDIDGETLLITNAHDPGDKTVFDLARLLVGNGANIHFKNHIGYNALHVAAAHDNTEYVAVLLSQDADINERTSDGYTSFVTHNEPTVGGHTALMLACWAPGVDEGGYCSPPAARYLIMHGADVNLTDGTGMTALMWLGNLYLSDDTTAVTIAKLLVEHGARVDLRDRHGKTAYQIASAHHLHRLAHYLRSVLGSKAKPVP